MIDHSLRYHSEAKSLGLDLNSYNLMEAAENGFIIEARILINFGADVNAINTRSNKCPLDLASEKGNTEIVSLLLSNGAHIERKGSICSPLELAVIHGHADIVAVLINHGANINNREGNKKSALQLASMNGHNDIVKLLIQSGADVNHYADEPALVYAVRNGHIDVVKTLLEGEAMIDYQDSRNCSVLETALMLRKKEIAKILIENGANIDGALDKAFQKKSTEIVEILLTKVIDVKYKDKYGKSLFMIAATHGELQLMPDLIEKGTDIEEKDNSGMTALMLASRNCCLKAVEMLIEKGANLNAKSNEGLTALMYASGSCFESKYVVETLIESGSRVNERSKDGSTALIFAALHRHTDILTVLIDSGADLNLKRNNGDSAIIFATAYEHIKTVEILIDGGADVNVFGKDGLSPRLIATRSLKHKCELLKTLERKSSISKHIGKGHDFPSQGVRYYPTSKGPEKNSSEDPLQMLSALPLDTEEQTKRDENVIKVLWEKLQSPGQLSQDEIFLIGTPQQLMKRKRTKRRVNKNVSKPQAVISYGSKAKCPKTSSRNGSKAKCPKTSNRNGLKVRADVMFEECLAKVSTTRSKEFTSKVTPNAQRDGDWSYCFSSNKDKVSLKHKRNLRKNLHSKKF